MNKSKPPVKLPSPTVHRLPKANYYLACLPCRTRQEAREIVKLHGKEPAVIVDAAVSRVLRVYKDWRTGPSLRELLTLALHLLP